MRLNHFWVEGLFIQRQMAPNYCYCYHEENSTAFFRVKCGVNTGTGTLNPIFGYYCWSFANRDDFNTSWGVVRKSGCGDVSECFMNSFPETGGGDSQRFKGITFTTLNTPSWPYATASDTSSGDIQSGGSTTFNDLGTYTRYEHLMDAPFTQEGLYVVLKLK